MQCMQNKLKHSEEGSWDPWAQALEDFYSAACRMVEERGGIINDVVHFNDDEVVDIVRDLGIECTIVRNRQKHDILALLPFFKQILKHAGDDMIEVLSLKDYVKLRSSLRTIGRSLRLFPGAVQKD